MIVAGTAWFLWSFAVISTAIGAAVTVCWTADKIYRLIKAGRKTVRR